MDNSMLYEIQEKDSHNSEIQIERGHLKWQDTFF